MTTHPQCKYLLRRGMSVLCIDSTDPPRRTDCDHCIDTICFGKTPAASKYTKHVSEDGTERYNNTRPAPSHSECYKKGYADAVANALSQHADCVKCLEEDRVTMLEHDATIRNQTLDDAKKYLEAQYLFFDKERWEQIWQSLRTQSTEARK